MKTETDIKLTFVSGLKDIVLKELSTYKNINILEECSDKVYVDYFSSFEKLKDLRSVLNIYAVRQGSNLNPHYISNHKSILGDLIEIAISESGDKFNTFKLSCAGSESEEVTKIGEYIKETYKLTNTEDADMEIFIGKSDGIWEVSVRLTSRPLSVRNYKVSNIKGGLNPTVAYAMNTYADLGNIDSYLNIFSGSATLLIEANKNTENVKFLGFDLNKKSNSLAIQNIKKAGFIRSIQIKTADIFDNPDFGKFDVITSDLPFGMQISKGEDLEKLYKHFIDYSSEVLDEGGRMIVYTSEYEIFESLISKSKFTLTEDISMKIPTSINSYLNTKILVCNLKN